jgi:RNA polymerase sigma factor (sigma-70 family)
MEKNEWLAEQFQENRTHLRAVAYRMLGSLSEADDAIQETWLRLSRSETNQIENLGGWLTTVISRVCLDMLRSRASRREEPLEPHAPVPPAAAKSKLNPEQEAQLAESVGLALLVVLDRLDPAERLAFVLHDIFAVPFDDIATILDRSPDAARQLASRARRRVRGPVEAPVGDLSRQRELIEAFITALRKADIEALVALLDPDVTVRADAAALAPGTIPDVHGAREWAKQAIAFGRGAVFARPALVDGSVGIVVAPRGRLSRVLLFTFAGEKISGIEVIADPARLKQFDLAVVPEP